MTKLNMKLIILLVLVISIFGCGSVGNKSLPRETRQDMSGKLIVFGSQAGPEMTASKPGVAFWTGAIIANSIAKSRGGRLMEQFQIKDPSEKISKALARAISRKTGAKLANAKPIALKSHKVKALSSSLQQYDYLIYVETTLWGYTNFIFEQDKLKVQYYAFSRLIDLKNGEAIARAMCTIASEKADAASTEEQLLTNNAKRLKSEILNTAQACYNEMYQKLMGKI